MRQTLSLATCVALVLVGRTAAADDLEVTTLEYGSWPAAVAALQADVRGQGRTVHVVVRDEAGQPVRCGAYTLQLDPVAGRAFVIGACDPATNATAVLLAARTALFDHGDVVPRPVPAGISAVQVRTGASAGGARTTGGSAVACSVAVRPYLMDMEHGVPVFLTPDRFALRPLAASVHAEQGANGWTLSTTTRGSIVVEYDVVDKARREVVLHDRTTLACGTESLPTPPPSAAPVASPPQARVAVSAAACTSERPRVAVRRMRMVVHHGGRATNEYGW